VVGGRGTGGGGGMAEGGGVMGGGGGGGWWGVRGWWGGWGGGWGAGPLGVEWWGEECVLGRWGVRQGGCDGLVLDLDGAAVAGRGFADGGRVWGGVGGAGGVVVWVLVPCGSRVRVGGGGGAVRGGVAGGDGGGDKMFCVNEVGIEIYCPTLAQGRRSRSSIKRAWVKPALLTTISATAERSVNFPLADRLPGLHCERCLS